MNFIDKALSAQNNLSDDDFLQAMAEMYEEPEVWDILEKYPQYVQDILYIIEYDTVLQMDGLAGVFDDCMADKLSKIYTALTNAGVSSEAKILRKAMTLNRERDDYDEQIEKLNDQTALNNNYDRFWAIVRKYIGKNR